jgi:uncharacterized protein YxjI
VFVFSFVGLNSNWFSWEFKFFLNNTLIAAVSKRFVHLTDTYGVALYENNPLVRFLCNLVYASLPWYTQLM